MKIRYIIPGTGSWGIKKSNYVGNSGHARASSLFRRSIAGLALLFFVMQSGAKAEMAPTGNGGFDPDLSAIKDLIHPVIVSKMEAEAGIMAYNNFTDITRNILSGRVSSDTITGVTDKVLQSTSPSLLLADNGQDEEVEAVSKGYMSRAKEGTSVFVNGEWIGVVGVYGHYFDQKRIEWMPNFKSSGYGLELSILKAVESQWLVGVYGAYQRLQAEAEAELLKVKVDLGEAEVGTWRVGPTLAFNASGFHAEGLLTYNWNNTDSKLQGTKTDYKSKGWDVYIRGGFDISLDSMVSGLKIVPEAQLYYFNKENKFKGVVADTIKILGEIDSGEGWISRLGGTVTYESYQFNEPLEFKASLGWQHNDIKTNDFKHTVSMSMHFDETSDIEKLSRLKGYDKDSAYYSLGVGSRLSEKLNLNMSYAGNWSENALGHYWQADLEFRF